MRYFPIKSIMLCSLTTALLASAPLALARNAAPLSANVGYVNLDNYRSTKTKVNAIRLKAIEETATALGARGGLAWRSAQINQSLKRQARYLDTIFNFNQLLIGGNVLPPVLVEANNPTSLDSDTTIRLASKTYRIKAQARFVTAAPTWRTYLVMDFKKPDMPDRTLLPQTRAEAEVWNQDIEDGWKRGLTQANQIFSANLSELKQDYLGIILYRKLLAKGMVTAPYVAKAELGVTGNSNELRIDDRVLRITSTSKLQTNPNKWKPVLTNPSNS